MILSELWDYVQPLSYRSASISLVWPNCFYLWWWKKGLPVTLPQIFCAVESPDLECIDC